MRPWLHSIIAAVTACSVGTAAGEPEDPLCKPLTQFASSVQPEQSRELEFHTIWFGSFKDSPDDRALYQKRCIHHGDPSAKAVCAYLMENSSVEFADHNLKRALECLSPGTRLGAQVKVDHGDFAFRLGDAERGNRVRLTFGVDGEIGGQVLRVTVRGVAP